MMGGERKHYKYLDLITGGFVAVLLCSNLIGPGKTCRVQLWHFPLVFGAGNLFFPVSYIFGDILTEVYGYAKSRRVIWAGFGALIFAAIMSKVVLSMPVNTDDSYAVNLQPALVRCFDNSPRIVLASILAFWVGDFSNSFVLAKMKILTQGRWLWTRTIGSTLVGQSVDSLIFYPLAFAGLWTGVSVFKAAAFNCIFKIAVEALLTPLTYLVVKALKRAEHEDFYDSNTSFTPFSLKE